MPISDLNNQFDPGVVFNSATNGVSALNELPFNGVLAVPANVIRLGAWLNPLRGVYSGATMNNTDVGGTRGRIGIYEVNKQTGAAGRRLAQTDDIDTTAIGFKIGLFLNPSGNNTTVVLNSQWYYMAVAVDSGRTLVAPVLRGSQGPQGWFTSGTSITPIISSAFALGIGWTDLPEDMTGIVQVPAAAAFTHHTLITA